MTPLCLNRGQKTEKVTSTCQFVFSIVELRWLVWFLTYFFVCIFVFCGENVSS